MPRPKNLTAKSARNVTLPDTLWSFIDTLDFDPAKGKPRYGHLKRYLERLVRADQKRIEGISNLANPDGE